VQSGQVSSLLSRLPGPVRAQVGGLTKAAFTSGLNDILLVAAIIALVSGVVALAAIRTRDFAHQQGPPPPAG
jgi:hypothetical protein